MPNSFRYFNSSPEVIRLVVMEYVKYPLSLRNVEGLLAERWIDMCHETVRLLVESVLTDGLRSGDDADGAGGRRPTILAGFGSRPAPRMNGA